MKKSNEMFIVKSKKDGQKEMFIASFKNVNTAIFKMKAEARKLGLFDDMKREFILEDLERFDIFSDYCIQSKAKIIIEKSYMNTDKIMEEIKKAKNNVKKLENIVKSYQVFSDDFNLESNVLESIEKANTDIEYLINQLSF